MVEPFMFGNHLHYEDMPPCATCIAENAAWESVVARTHTYELAGKITKTKAWRAYRQAKPFDEHERTLSLDQMMDAGTFIADDAEELLDAYARTEEVERFREHLTPRQLQIMDMLLAGQDSREIADTEGYTSTGGVRYHKHVIRHKYRDFRDQ